MRETRSVGEGVSERDAGDATRRLAIGFALLVVATWALIVLGALVRANQAGLACPDWPLCFGELVPRMNLRVAFEWSHRAIAGSLSIAFLGLAVSTWGRVAELRALLLVAGALLALQVVLGALTVWETLAPWTVTSHLITGNAFAAALLLVAAALRDRARGEGPSRSVPAASRPLFAAAGACLLLQLLLGGLVSSRYAGLACPEWPACNAGVWFPTLRGPVGLHLFHRMNGYLLILLLTAGALACRGTPRLGRIAAAGCALAWIQAGVGVANVVGGLPVEVTGAHSALAAALVLTLALALRETSAGAPPGA